jgi:hypothetical protein
VDDRALDAAARAVYERYQREVVEAFDFCPYALRARTEGAVRVEVCLRDVVTHEELLPLVDRLADDGHVEIGLLLFPRLFIARTDWQRFVGALHDLDAKTERPQRKQFAFAAFHPEAEADTASPARLVSFIRRTPDPTIQLVRLSVLARVRTRDPRETTYVPPDELDEYLRTIQGTSTEARLPLHERIARANLATVQQLGVATITEVLDRILDERDQRYTLLGERARRSTQNP